MRHLHAILAASTLALHALVASAATAAERPEAAEVILVTGRGTATDPGTGAIRDLGKGDRLYSGEIINTGANTYVNMKFADGAFVLLRPNTRFAIEQFAYAKTTEAAQPAAPATAPTPAPMPKRPSPAAAATTAPAPAAGAGLERAFLRLLKGGFRTVSGLIGKANPDEYKVTTPVATIGIRGTDYYGYICDLACANDPIVRASLDEFKIDQSLALGATLDGVTSGSIAVTNAAGHTEILTAGQFMLTLTDGRQIRLPEEPRFLRVQPFPDPTTLCAS